MDLSELIGDVLREKMLELGLNNTTYAEKVGYRQSYISKVVNGKSTNIPVKTLERLVNALDMSQADFWAEIEKKKFCLI